jgi:hypothetical protein
LELDDAAVATAKAAAAAAELDLNNNDTCNNVNYTTATKLDYH